MLSNFVHRLLFVKEFEIGEGSTEIIGTRQMVVPLQFMLSMQQADPDKFYQYMHSSIQTYFSRVQLELGEETYKRMEEVFDVFGLGKLRVVDFDKANFKALVEVHNPPICIESGGGHVCSITTGVLAGMFSQLLGKEVHAVVNKCTARGAQNCEFIIK